MSATVKREPFDGIHAVAPHQLATHDALEAWGRWARERSGRSVESNPIFRLAKSSWARSGYGTATPPPILPALAMRVERTVRDVPQLERDALRWWYVSNTRPELICRQIGIRYDALADTLHRGRQLTRELAERRYGRRWDDPEWTVLL